ncbi:hypothetical protein RGQ29_019040 [Quercus rubra]|uniref:FBD domain-containing protein n=1 Tax=Quercus rubra TaxID=3512 RepID=A0AAN7F9L5_QUERU|nr:hypothetical protein RGQ29_019040 [Quercus rubra]
MDEESESHGSINGEAERSSAYSEDSFRFFLNHSNHTFSFDRNPFSEEEYEDSILFFVNRSSTHTSSFDRNTIFEEEEESKSSPSCLPKTLSKHGVLSKRWSCIWTYVPCLSFDNDYFQYTDDVASAIDNTLILQRAPKLTKFFVRFHYELDLKPRLDLWLHFATTAKVNQLSLHLTVAIDFSISDAYFNAYLLPQHLYTNEFVSELFFCFCKIKPKGLVRWSSLTCLVIKLTTLCEDAIRKVNRLDIVSESLRKLVIYNYFMVGSDDPVFELEIVAPKIESLETLGYFCTKKCRIKEASSLIEAKLSFILACQCVKSQETVRELLQSVHHVKELTIGKWCLLVLSIMSVKNLPSPLLKCKCLTIKTSIKKWDLPDIASLLQSSPHVETLDIDITSSYYKGLCCYASRVKTVKIFGFEESLVHIKEVFILVVEFLLKNTRVLEKMVIAKPHYIQNQRHMLLDFLEVAQKLLSIPRSSPHVVIMFPYQ